MSDNNTAFKFWDKYMDLQQEELELFNFVLQFDFGSGNAEYSCEEIKAENLPLNRVLGCLRFIICGYREGENTYLAFLDIDSEGSVGYTFIREGSEEAVQLEEGDIVAANIYAIVCDTLAQQLG